MCNCNYFIPRFYAPAYLKQNDIPEVNNINMLTISRTSIVTCVLYIKMSPVAALY